MTAYKGNERSHNDLETRKASFGETFSKLFIWMLCKRNNYGTLRKKEKAKLEATEICLWFKLTKTSWTDIETNIEVLKMKKRKITQDSNGGRED